MASGALEVRKNSQNQQMNSSVRNTDYEQVLARKRENYNASNDLARIKEEESVSQSRMSSSQQPLKADELLSNHKLH